MLFCRDIKICRDLHTFWKTLDFALFGQEQKTRILRLDGRWRIYPLSISYMRKIWRYGRSKPKLKKGSGGWYWQIFSDDTLRSARQKQIRRCSTFFANQLCNQSCLEHSSAEPGALCAFFLQHQFVLAFILLFCLSKLWHAKAVSCQLDRTSEVNAFAYF